MTHIDTFINLLTTKIGNPTVKSELQHMWNELHNCPIIIQSGSRKGKKCGKKCLYNKLTCYSHDTLQMCSYEHCMRKCTSPDTICDFHKKEEKRIEMDSLPYPYVRWNDPFYVIKGTTIIIDIPNQLIRGYKKDLQCISEETDEIKKACSYYKLRFVPLSETNIL